jgi:THO complex subunit 2
MEQQQIDKKFARAYTKTYFEQNKYSLIKENNEGFSKLLLLLTNLTDTLSYNDAWNKILTLVGKFDLDPDRVLDLIIESQLLNPSRKIYTNLIQKFKGESITTILANRLSKIPENKSKTLVFAGYF